MVTAAVELSAAWGLQHEPDTVTDDFASVRMIAGPVALTRAERYTVRPPSEVVLELEPEVDALAGFAVNGFLYVVDDTGAPGAARDALIEQIAADETTFDALPANENGVRLVPRFPGGLWAVELLSASTGHTVAWLDDVVAWAAHVVAVSVRFEVQSRGVVPSTHALGKVGQIAAYIGSTAGTDVMLEHGMGLLAPLADPVDLSWTTRGKWTSRAALDVSFALTQTLIGPPEPRLRSATFAVTMRNPTVVESF